MYSAQAPERMYSARSQLTAQSSMDRGASGTFLSAVENPSRYILHYRYCRLLVTCMKAAVMTRGSARNLDASMGYI